MKPEQTPKTSSQIYLEEVTLSNGMTLSFAAGDILLIVGPNNSGKSTFLRNIFEKLKDFGLPRKMLKEVSFSITKELAKKRIRDIYSVDDHQDDYWFISYNDGRSSSVDFSGVEKSQPKFGEAARAIAITLNAETRLSLSNPTDTFDIYSGRASHPFHTFMLDRRVLRRFAAVIKDAFALDFTVNRIGNPLRGYVGVRFQNDEEGLEADKNIPDLGEPIEAQGDGIRSYSGIAAEIVGSDHPITLLDEPEAFLHPPQAKKLGRLLLSALPIQRQAFVATHSSDFLQGVLTSKSERIKVLRLERVQGALKANLLGNEELQAALTHPSIANTNLLDALFFSQTVICEGDSDCSLYDWVVRELADESFRKVDRFWFATGGKHQAAKIAKLLAAFGVDFRVILDLDALIDWRLLEQLSALKGLNIQRHKKRIEAALKVLQPPPVGSVTAEIRSLLPSLDPFDEASENQLLREIAKSLEKARRSHPLKQYGIAAFRKGQERNDVETFLQELQRAGITLLPKGEIESYVPQVGLHGPGWASIVLEHNESHGQGLQELLRDIYDGISE